MVFESLIEWIIALVTDYLYLGELLEEWVHQSVLQ